MPPFTIAADRFTDAIYVSWDSFTPWDDTAREGLSDVDCGTLRLFCEETGEDFDLSRQQVEGFVRAHRDALAAR